VQIATDLTGMVDPTGLSDIVNAGALAAQGDTAGAAIAIASIAVPFGAEKLAKAVRRVPVKEVSKATSKIADAGTQATKRMDDVRRMGDDALEAAEKAKRKCLDAGNCFIAGTQVVTTVQRPDTGVAIAGLTTNQYMAAEDGPSESLDHLYAAGAFVLMAGLSYQRRSSKRKKQERQKQLQPV